ncbi:NADPH-dependent diflavin oxidoreductase 1, partial [Coelomomyces lativittatus]
NFWKFLLRKSLTHHFLLGLEFTIFGLGDSSYEKYNFPARKLVKRLLQLGATTFHEKGEGDDQHPLGLEGTFQPWLQSVLTSLSLPPLKDTWVWQPSYDFEPSDEPWTPVWDPQRYPCTATILSHQRMTPSHHFQDVRHLACALASDPPSLSPGDSVAIQPHNDPGQIQDLIDLLGWQAHADQVFFIKAKDEDFPVPSYLQTPVSLRFILESVVSPYSVPTFNFFEVLIPYVVSDTHRLKLLSFLTPEGQEDVYQYVYRPKRTCVEVLQDFPSNLPIHCVLELFPWLRERVYSVANHAKSHFELCIALVQYTTAWLKEPRIGIASRFWKSPWTQVHAQLRFRPVPGAFQLPPHPAIPILCIGPGTGIAPLRSLLQTWLQCSTITPNYLLFGGRSKSCDFYFEQEWEQWQGQGRLQVWCAFSRDQPTKVYVQHVLKCKAQQVFHFLHVLGGYVYISGRAKGMPSEVYSEFVEIVQSNLGCNKVEAELYMKKLKDSKRYQIETWE